MIKQCYIIQLEEPKYMINEKQANDNKFNEKSYNKSKTVRKLFRNEMFERSRQVNAGGNNYLSFYSQQMQMKIKQSLEGPIPSNLPLPSNATVQTISYFRRANKPVFKTKINPEDLHDPHMTFQSLWFLAGIDDIQSFPNSQKVSKQFQDNLMSYLALPYSQIRQMAIIAAGNKILGKQQDILQIVNQDENQLWVLINHIYQRKINYTLMYNYLNKNLPIIYRTIYDMSNNQKDEIIESIIKNQDILQLILDAMTSAQLQSDIPLYCVRIIGNILAERDNYSEILMRYKLLDRLFLLLKSPSNQLKKDILWLLSNYICDAAPANEILCKNNLLQKICIMYRKQNSQSIKIQLYYVLAYLAYYGSNLRMFKLALQQNILQQCRFDMQSQNLQLTQAILDLIYKLIKIGEQYSNNNDNSEDMQGRNPFITYIQNSKLRNLIHIKTYNQNQDISNISFDIMECVEEYESKFGDGDMGM